jgi:hypothetical protein
MIWLKWRRVGIVAGALLLLSPLTHLGFIQDVDFNEFHEHAFIERLAPTIPAGCTIYQYVGSYGLHEARFRRAGYRLSSDGESQIYDLRTIEIPREHNPENELNPDSKPNRDEILKALSNPPECAYYYEGLPCWSVKKTDEAISPYCAIMREAWSTEEVAHTTFSNRPYDINLAWGFKAPYQDGVEFQKPLEIEFRFTLKKILAARPAKPTAPLLAPTAPPPSEAPAAQPPKAVAEPPTNPNPSPLPAAVPE